MKQLTPVALGLLVAGSLIAAACGGGGNTTTVSTVAGGGTAVHTAPITGIGEVDAVANAALNGDTIQLAALTGYAKVACTTNPAPGGGAPPVCRDTESDGTQVEVLASKACEQEWVRPEQVPDTFAQALKDTPTFDAAYVPKDGGGISAQYVVVFTTGTRSDGSPSGAALYIKDGRIAMVQTECNAFSELVNPDVVQSYVATPISGAGASATPAATTAPATP